MNVRYVIIGVALITLITILVFNVLKRRKSISSLTEWFSVYFDEEKVKVSAQLPNKVSWEQSFLWSDIVRICYKSEGVSASDGIYVFTNKRSESFVIPIEAKGGAEFWSKIIDLGLFPSELAIKIASFTEGECSCWPSDIT